MHMKDNLINFLYDKNYFLTFYDNNLYIFNYLELIELGKEKIVIKMPNFTITIIGSDLYISRLLPKEILIVGKLANIGYTYE